MIDVNYEELSANVSIINAQNDEELVFIPSVIESVPLKDLYAITSEEFVDLDLIADYLDQLRCVQSARNTKLITILKD